MILSGRRQRLQQESCSPASAQPASCEARQLRRARRSRRARLEPCTRALFGVLRVTAPQRISGRAEAGAPSASVYSKLANTLRTTMDSSPTTTTLGCKLPERKLRGKRRRRLSGDARSLPPHRLDLAAQNHRTSTTCPTYSARRSKRRKSSNGSRPRPSKARRPPRPLRPRGLKRELISPERSTGWVGKRCTSPDVAELHGLVRRRGDGSRRSRRHDAGRRRNATSRVDDLGI